VTMRWPIIVVHNNWPTCDGDEINLHLPQGVHVTAELQTILSVSEQIVTGQSGSPVVKLIQDAVVDEGLSC
jgi:DNA-directed RNA polymerase beta' subunit